MTPNTSAYCMGNLLGLQALAGHIALCRGPAFVLDNYAPALLASKATQAIIKVDAGSS